MEELLAEHGVHVPADDDAANRSGGKDAVDPTIAIVTSDATLAAVAADAFRRRSPRIAVCATPAELAAVLRESPEFLILDADTEGFPFRAALRAAGRRSPATSACLVAGSSGLSRAAALAREHGSELLAKPVPAARLRRAAMIASRRGLADREGRAFVERLTESNRLLAETQNRLRQRILAVNQELLSLQELNGRIFQNLGSGLILLDAEGRVSRVNPAAEAILGTSESDALGAPADRVFRTERERLLSDALSGEFPPYDDEVIVARPDGQCVPLLLRTSRLHDESGRVVGLVAIFSDLTRLKRQDQEIRRIERLASLGELSAGMAHEIRNPLAGIEMTAELLGRRLGAEDPSRALITMIVDEVRRLNRLIEDLLRFARPGAPQFTSHAIPQLLDRCIGLLSRKSQEKRLVIRREYDDPFPLVDLDPAQMTQVFLNVILNAIEASPPFGTILLTASLAETSIGRDGGRAGHAARVEIRDAGPGIAPEIAERIWNPFFTTKPSGTGLGLSICQRIVEEHRGRISLAAAPEGGSLAVVELPVPLFGEGDLPDQEAIRRLSDIYG